MEHELSITAKEAGVASSPVEAAEAAYEFGRNGNIISDLISYVKCLFSETELDYEDAFSIDDEYVRDVIDKSVKQVKAGLMGAGLTIDDEYITIIKGADTINIDTDEIFALISDAFRAQNYTSIEYEPQISASDDIDLEDLYDTLYTEPVNSVYDKETGTVVPHVSGLSFDRSEARRLWDGAKNGEKILIPLIITEPDITSDYLESVLFVNLLGQKSTSLAGSSSARINNIAKAAEAINGTILNPGEEFSYNGVVGQRTAAKGYMGAGAYNNGQVVTEIGGGICQVSSTLYYVSLLANLEIVERVCHYFEVAYLPLGLDATVSWPGPDFRFKNNRDYPLKIEIGTDISKLLVTVKIYGTDADGSYVELTSEPWVTAMGRGATSYRWVYDKDGNLINKFEESKSQYHYHVEEGTEPPEETETPSPSPTASEEPSPTPTQTASPTPTQTVAPTPTEPVSPNPTEPVPTPTQPVPTPTQPVSPPPEEPSEPLE